ADLAPAACRQGQLEHGGIAPMLDHAIRRDRFLAFVAAPRRTDTQAAIHAEAAVQRARALDDPSFDHRRVAALDGARLELSLECALRGGRLREDDQPRGLAIQAV